MPDEPGQVLRLARFRQEHPDVTTGPGEFGTWQARIPEATGGKGKGPPVATGRRRPFALVTRCQGAFENE
jgi:hypothetical protein